MTQPPNQQPGWGQPPTGPGAQPQWQQPGSPAQWQQGPQSQPQWQPQQQQPAAPQGYPGQPAPGTPPQGQYSGFGGGFQQSSAYGGLGAFGGEDQTKKGPRSKKPWIIGGAVVLVLAAGGVVAWLLGAFRGEVLDQGSLQDGVLKVLRESYGEGDVKDARCPDDQATKTGTTFECSVTVAGQQKKVAIRVLNDKPEFEVGAPK
ncbi:DUF4333 domain-containing protein [Amycolatopsis anabasis]|uniref:DUF4333 domain-containing protein n=1 Tax=Amycolatopsis anabasis TaxID=1840409 RepID=UPI00131C2A9F|nr:DUF4333 domain-containing protein [Amycolatopsis anabasis]